MTEDCYYPNLSSASCEQECGKSWFSYRTLPASPSELPAKAIRACHAEPGASALAASEPAELAALEPAELAASEPAASVRVASYLASESGHRHTDNRRHHHHLCRLCLSLSFRAAGSQGQ